MYSIDSFVSPSRTLLVAALVALSSTAVAQATLPPPADVGPLTRLTPTGVTARSPQFSPDGSRVVFADGDGDLHIVSVDGTGLTRVTSTPFEERDPTFTRDGAHVIYAANPDGDFDLFQTELAAPLTPTRLTDLEGDEVEPAASPLAFTLYSVGDDGCSDVAAYPLETYDKLLFTRQYDARSEVWFQGVGEALEGDHSGRVSPEGQACDQPAWAGNGLAAAYRCSDGEAGLSFSSAEYDASLESALGLLVTLEGCESDWGELDWLTDECLQGLPRRYASYPANVVGGADLGLSAPAFSANQVVYLASPSSDADSGPIHVRPRGAEGNWQALGVNGGQAVWSPDGTRLALTSDHEGEPAIYLVETDFYLQDVMNLVDYPELVAQPSSRLHGNRFAARPGVSKEFFHLYDAIDYADRGAFVTADAVLQAFHDEFTSLLREAEQTAEEELARLTTALFEHYVARHEASGDDWDRFLALYFAVPHAILLAGERFGATPAGYDDWECGVASREPDLPPEDREWFDRVCAPVLDPPPVPELLAEHLPAAALELPDSVRDDAAALLGHIVAQGEVGEVVLPSGDRLPVDWTQFIVRGDYADRDRADYFQAIMWYGQVPLPVEAAVVDMMTQLDAIQVPGVGGGEGPAYEAWQRIDGMIGSFIGAPVQATPDHVRALQAESPGLLAPFDSAGVNAWLRTRLGPAATRGLEGALSGEAAPVRISFFPRRLGLDTTFFSRLTHPTIDGRGAPSSLDVWASLGLDRARERVLAAEASETWADAYRDALDEILAERGAGSDTTVGSTDIYASWLATLLALGQSQAGLDATLLPFTASQAWNDRLLYSTLAGYAQLKHAAVLYAMEDYGVQCGGELIIYGFVEQPVMAPPRGFVDPVPAFFRSMVNLADQVYAALNEGEVPAAHSWDIDDDVSVRYLAEQLADMAEREVRGEPLEDFEYAFLQDVGTLLELLFVGFQSTDAQVAGASGRTERGVALTVGIYTNVMREQVLHLGVGRLLDLFVIVPDGVGQRLTQGGLLSFYEFWHPMSDRLTDEAWNARIETGDAPPMPDWSSSFIEPPAP